MNTLLDSDPLTLLAVYAATCFFAYGSLYFSCKYATGKYTNAREQRWTLVVCLLGPLALVAAMTYNWIVTGRMLQFRWKK